MNKLQITTAVRKVLLADAKVSELLESKIFPLVAPKDTKGSFIIYKREKYVRDYTKMGAAQDACEVYIIIVSDNYDQSQLIAVEVDRVLSTTPISYSTALVDSEEDYADSKYFQVLLYEFK